MKKIIAIIIIILILFIFVFLLINNKKDNIKNNQYKTIPFYKEINKKRYIQYKKRNPNLSNYKIVLNVNIGLDYNFYENISKSNYLNTPYVLVNKYNYLDKDYIPSNLEKIDNTMLVNIAKKAFLEMKKNAKKDNYNLVAISGYRSYYYQKRLYESYVKYDGISNADTYSARSGFSEHQTGLAVDISNGKKPYTEFETTNEYLWMINNSYKYGFILRYPKGKENITGYVFESWHYRYVGIEIASYIKKHSITFEEYYASFIY